MAAIQPPESGDTWERRAEALRQILADFAVLHGLVMDEIGHPLPPHLRDFVRDWLDSARAAVEKQARQP